MALGTWSPVAALRVARTPALRRVELAYLLFGLATYSTWLAVFVYAEQRGGAKEMAFLALLLLVPAAVLAPFAAYAGDRFAPHRALAVGYAVQVLGYGVAAVFMAADNAALAYVGALVGSVAVTFTKPVMMSLLPTVTPSPAQFVAANALTSLIDQAALLAGPLAAGVVMLVASPAAVFAVGAAATAASTMLAMTAHTPGAADPVEVSAGDVVRQVFAGFATMRRTPRVALLMLFTGCAALVIGAADMLFVIFAEERLNGAGAQSSLLSAAAGCGALLAGALAVGILQSPRASTPILWGAVAAAGAFIALGATDALAPAMLLFAVQGAGSVVVTVTATVALQRQAPTAVLARVFGIAEAIATVGLTVGSVLVTTLVDALSLTTALAISAGATLALVLPGVVTLRRMGEHRDPPPADVVDRLIADPVFALLPAPVIEQLARNTTRIVAPAGTPVVVKGEVGDRYYLIVDGRCEVSERGGAPRDIVTGESFGEIALLRGVPRTATVTPQVTTSLLAVERDDFLQVVTRHGRCRHLAADVVDEHLGRA